MILENLLGMPVPPPRDVPPLKEKWRENPHDARADGEHRANAVCRELP